MGLASITEYSYVSRYAQDPLTLGIHIGGNLANADAAVTAEMVNVDSGASVQTYTATNTSPGIYTFTTSSTDTDTPGNYKFIWTYDIATVPQTYETFIEIGDVAPAFDFLTPDFKDMIERVWQRFADGFDSPLGGPNLQVYFQSHFGRGRVAQAAGWALNRINIQGQPRQSYSLGPPAPFPLIEWGGLLEQGTYVEVVKHLIRSYVEQPEPFAINVARMDRKDYMQRWMEVLQMEEAVFKGMVDTFRIRNMGLGGGRVLVSGGVFGNYGPTRMAGNSLSARPRFWARFY